MDASRPAGDGTPAPAELLIQTRLISAMKRTLLAAIAVVGLATGCGTDEAPAAVSSAPTSSTAVPASSERASIEPVEATTTTVATSTDTSGSNGGEIRKEAERQVTSNPDGSAKLALELTKLTGEKLSPTDAQEMAGYLCVIIVMTEMNNTEGYSDEDVVEETSREMGISKEDAIRLLTLAVKYRCPDSAFN